MTQLHDVAHPALFFSRTMPVREDWVDYNGHLNHAYYLVLFDQCCDAFVPEIGCGPEYREQTGHSIFTVDARVRYRRELNVGDKVFATLQILNFDSKRVHLALSLYHIEGWLSATIELLWLHVDQNAMKVIPFPHAVSEKISMFRKEHSQAKVPDWVGESVSREIFGDLPDI